MENNNPEKEELSKCCGATKQIMWVSDGGVGDFCSKCKKPWNVSPHQGPVTTKNNEKKPKLVELSKCCNAKSRYEKDWGNHHDECTKCGLECEVYEGYLSPQEPMEWAKENITPYKTDLKSIQCKHSYLRNNFGKATFCMNELCEKKSKRFEWCKKTECEYTFNPDDYIWLCRSCHRKYDLTPEKKEKATKNLWWKSSPTAPNIKGINQYTNGKPHIGRRNV